MGPRGCGTISAASLVMTMMPPILRRRVIEETDLDAVVAFARDRASPRIPPRGGGAGSTGCGSVGAPSAIRATGGCWNSMGVSSAHS